MGKGKEGFVYCKQQIRVGKGGKFKKKYITSLEKREYVIVDQRLHGERLCFVSNDITHLKRGSCLILMKIWYNLGTIILFGILMVLSKEHVTILFIVS